MALIQGMENANKTRVRFGRCSNGGFLEGAGLVPFAPFSFDDRLRQHLAIWFQKAVLVLFDEGHEPAALWSQVVRSLPCARINFTATAFRDDFKDFRHRS